jgi:DNA-binding transcriptional regulator YhcF (GntR family)
MAPAFCWLLRAEGGGEIGLVKRSTEYRFCKPIGPIMALPAPDAGPLPLSLDRGLGTPMSGQLYDQLRELILSGRLPPGTRLPSTRGLAAELLVSRNTVVACFDQLFAEGYVSGAVGAGTFVAEGAAGSGRTDKLPAIQDLPGPSQRGTALAAMAPPRA